MADYGVHLEIAGPLAMFTRPDTGGTPTSYPAPTWSACKGIFESIMRFGSGEAWIDPVEVEICKRVGEEGGVVQFQRYTTNYGGPLRKGDQVRKGAALQLFANVLCDVCYRIRGEIRGVRRSRREGKNGNNPRHELQERFNRALRQGRAYRTPCLGWSEFTATYWGPPRDGTEGTRQATEVDTAITVENIPAMLRSVFADPVSPTGGGRYAPRFDHGVSIRDGVVRFERTEGAADAR